MPETSQTPLEQIRLLEKSLEQMPFQMEERLRGEVLPAYVSLGAVEDQARVLEQLAEFAVDGRDRSRALYIYVEELKPLYIDILKNEPALLRLTERVAYLIAQQVAVEEGAAVLWEALPLFTRLEALDRWEATLREIVQFQEEIGQAEEARALLEEGRAVLGVG